MVTIYYCRPDFTTVLEELEAIYETMEPTQIPLEIEIMKPVGAPLGALDFLNVSSISPLLTSTHCLVSYADKGLCCPMLIMSPRHAHSR